MREREEGEVRQVHHRDHRPEHFPQPESRHEHAAQHAAGEQRGHAGAVQPAERFRGEAESAGGARVLQERRGERAEQRLGKPEEQNEQQEPAHAGLCEKGAPAFGKGAPRRGVAAAGRSVLLRFRQHGRVPAGERERHDREDRERDGPRLSDGDTARDQRAGAQHDDRGGKDFRQTEGRVADAGEERLLAAGAHAEEIKPVGGDIVRRAAQRDEREAPESERHRISKERRQREPCEGDRAHELPDPNPPALRAVRVHERTPERLQHPRQRGERERAREPLVVHAEILEEHRRDILEQSVRQPLGEIQRGHPEPRGGDGTVFGQRHIRKTA